MLKQEKYGRETGLLKIGSPVLSPRLWGPGRHVLVHGFGRSRRPILANVGRLNHVEAEKDIDGNKPKVAFDEKGRRGLRQIKIVYLWSLAPVSCLQVTTRSRERSKRGGPPRHLCALRVCAIPQNEARRHQIPNHGNHLSRRRLDSVRPHTRTLRSNGMRYPPLQTNAR